MANTRAYLKIHLLGAFRVTLNDEVITQFDADSARALLAYLVLHSDHAHQRAALANLFWCDQPAESSLHNLRSALSRLRKALNDHDDAAQPLLLVTRQTIQWNPKCAVWVDVLEFDHLLSAVKHHVHRRLAVCPWCIQRLTQLAELYRGEFLTDLRVESLPFDEWRQIEREQLHRLAMQSFHLLADYHQQGGTYSEAERYARQQIALERWSEEAHLQLIYALWASGQRSAALAQYELCRGILAAEFGVEPAPATTALYAEMRQRSRRPKQPTMLAFVEDDGVWATRRTAFPNNLPAPTTPFVNRQAELDTLLQRLVNPANRLTTLIGEGGIGKTRLALTVGHALVRSFAAGVWFVPLADLPSSTQVQQAEAAIIAQLCHCFKLEATTFERSAQRLLDYLGNKELLLILDNFEHLHAGVLFLHKVLQDAPNVTLLVTSRQRLGFQGEYLLRLPPLAQACAVQLFVERVRTGCPEFAASVAQMALAEEICSYLHGNPLAIELAAAQVRRQGLAAICALIKRGPGELSSDHADVPVRHRSLHTVFQHSWQLLTPDEQRALLDVAHLPGQFAGLTAQARAGISLGLLADLRDKSVLVQDAEERYSLPALIQPFARALTLQ